MPTACNGASKTCAQVSCLLQYELPLVGPEACCRDRAGRLLGTGHLQLPSGERQTALFPAVPTVRQPDPRTLGLSQAHLGDGKPWLTGGHSPTPPSRARFLPSLAQGRPSRRLPNFRRLPQLPGRVGAGSTCAPPKPTRAWPPRATHPAPGGAPLPPQREPAPQQRRQVFQPRPRRRRRLLALRLSGAWAAAQGAVRRCRRRGQGRALARRLHFDGAHGHPHALAAAAAPAAPLPRARLRAPSTP